MGMSVGLVAVDGARDLEDVMVVVDRAMYAAKARRDGPRVVVVETATADESGGVDAAPHPVT
jgi:hypothetical protein